jgi:hypothetical protein
MSLGAGKYDEECTSVRETTGAEGVILIVIDGLKGSGFSMQASLDITLRLPAVLRRVANSIETDFKAGKL